MGDRLDEQTIERLIQKMSQSINSQSPYEHLYNWLKEKDPMLFTQWESVYAVVRASEDY